MTDTESTGKRSRSGSATSVSQVTVNPTILAADCIASVNQAFEKYKDDDFILKRIHTYFTTQFDTVIENIRVNREQRQQYMQDMTAEQIAFIQSFLNKNKYYYLPTTDKFVVYDEIHYSTISEDDIIYHVLTDISRDEKQLMPWKQKTKVSIMKRVKESQLMRAIPNSETIQQVLESVGAFFASKQETKYFLTVVGDNLLRKKQELVHLVPSKTKAFLRELTGFSQVFTGANPASTMRYKYHEHDYALCRLIHMNDTVKHDHLWSPYLVKHSLDIIAVAYHYSTRYGDADNYLENKCNDKVIENQIFFLRNHSPANIVDMFADEYIVSTATSASSSVTSTFTFTYIQRIDWKTMQYLWKHFLDARNLPAVIFQSSLKQMFTQKWQYDETGDVFIGISSKYLPYIQQFLQFWTETMTYDPTELDLEIDEVATLYRMYKSSASVSAASSTSTARRSAITEAQILDLLAYYYPQVEIESNKYIHHVKCAMWDKQMDVITAITSCVSDGTPCTIYDAYDQYCRPRYAMNLPTVGKTYFEKYVLENMSEFIVDGKNLKIV